MKRRGNNNIKISKGSYEKLSDLRRAQVSDAVLSKTAVGSPNLSASVAHSPLYKKSSITNPMGPLGQTSSVDRMMPDVYSPLFQLSNLNLPRDRVTMNSWNRIFYDTHPIVRNAINLHASYPISKINITI